MSSANENYMRKNRTGFDFSAWLKIACQAACDVARRRTEIETRQCIHVCPLDAALARVTIAPYVDPRHTKHVSVLEYGPRFSRHSEQFQGHRRPLTSCAPSVNDTQIRALWQTPVSKSQPDSVGFSQSNNDARVKLCEIDFVARASKSFRKLNSTTLLHVTMCER